MGGAASSKNAGVKSRRSRSFSGFLGGYPNIPQGPRSRLGEAENEEGEESVEGADSEETPSDQPLVSQAEPNFLKMMEQMTQLMGQLTQYVSPRDNSRAP
ncbi:hypothetical protein O181_073067 [Austropuccinia psidii MF-1]|uniref:Uncharacterized protein n=1 Tax=Austropuccinia psidii MF-1 TaxID=1389203 RepID=A0A9Q3IAP9_9BASI|nr:hypothetical protein [Austropuccinia psidii MF-1]